MSLTEEVPETKPEPGKKELVELLTGIKSEKFLGHVTTAMNEKLALVPADIPRVAAAFSAYKANRIRNYGENGAYTLYFLPAFDLVEQAYAAGDFEKFKQGCELMLDLIAND